MEKINYEKELADFRKHLEQFNGKEFGDADEVCAWLDEFDKTFGEVSHKMIKKQPESTKEKGFVELYFLGLARFTCRILNKMERDGMFNEEKGGIGFFMNVLMPVCDEMVKRKLDDEDRKKKAQEALLNDICNFDLSIDAILERNFPKQKDDWDEIRKLLNEARENARKFEGDDKD